jgi:hypothetical protein
MSQIKVEAPKGLDGSSCGSATTSTKANSSASDRHRRRRAASWRLPALESGRSDPWWHEPPAAGYEEAAGHLLACGLLPAPNREGLRLMSWRGGHHRRGAELIAERWAA